MTPVSAPTAARRRRCVPIRVSPRNYRLAPCQPGGSSPPAHSLSMPRPGGHRTRCKGLSDARVQERGLTTRWPNGSQRGSGAASQRHSAGSYAGPMVRHPHVPAVVIGSGCPANSCTAARSFVPSSASVNAVWRRSCVRISSPAILPTYFTHCHTVVGDTNARARSPGNRYSDVAPCRDWRVLAQGQDGLVLGGRRSSSRVRPQKRCQPLAAPDHHGGLSEPFRIFGLKRPRSHLRLRWDTDRLVERVGVAYEVDSVPERLAGP